MRITVKNEILFTDVTSCVGSLKRAILELRTPVNDDSIISVSSLAIGYSYLPSGNKRVDDTKVTVDLKSSNSQEMPPLISSSSSRSGACVVRTIAHLISVP